MKYHNKYILAPFISLLLLGCNQKKIERPKYIEKQVKPVYLNTIASKRKSITVPQELKQLVTLNISDKPVLDVIKQLSILYKVNIRFDFSDMEAQIRESEERKKQEAKQNTQIKNPYSYNNMNRNDNNYHHNPNSSQHAQHTKHQTHSEQTAQKNVDHKQTSNPEPQVEQKKVSPTDLLNKKIFFKCQSMPFLESIKKLCEAAHLRIQIYKDEIIISHDAEYNHTHEISFLSNKREAKTTSNSHSSQGLNVGSSVNINSSHNSDLWAEITSNLDFILQSSSKSNKYTINKQAGILIARGTQKQHRKLHEFLKQLHKRVSSQVLIETKILSVKLKHEFKTGINWNSLNIYNKFKNKGDMLISSEYSNNNAFKVMSSQNGNTDELISLLEDFGEVYTVANPTSTVLNNQYSVFKVAENYTYFTSKQANVVSHNINTPYVIPIFNTQVQTVPIGMILSVQPSINFRNNTVTLFLHPNISDVSSTVEDPAVKLMAQNRSDVTSLVPVVSSQEMDTTVRTNHGDLIIVGGLIKKSTANNKKGIPGVTKLPILGQTHKSEKYEEIVIMLKTYIIPAPEYYIIHDVQDYELQTLSSS